MLDENNMNITEIINYGYPYYRKIDIYNEILNQLFDNSSMNFIINWSRNFYKDLRNDYNFSLEFIDNYQKNGDLFSISYNEETSKREITFDFCSFVSDIVRCFENYDGTGELINVTGTSKQIRNLAVRKLINIRESLLEYNGITSNQSLKSNSAREKLIDLLNKNIISIKILYKDIYINKKYDIESYFEKCDKEKLLFHTMIRGVNDCSSYEYEDGFIYTVIKYYKEKQDTGLNITYIGYIGEKSKAINYKYPNFLDTFQKYMLAHPKINMAEFDFDSSNMTITEFNEAVKKFNNEILKKNWEVDVEFLPTKETGATHQENSGIESNGQSLIAIKKKKLYALNENQIYMRIRGVKKLKGYTAMVFRNGMVILEINDIKNDKIVTKSGAAYVMPLPLFNKLCEYSRTELREYKKNNPTANLECIHHRSNWEEKIQSIIDTTTGISIGEESKVLVKKD